MLAAGRLDQLLRSVWNDANDPSSELFLPAVGKAREIIADHRKLLGLDAPQEILVTSPTQRELDAFVASVVVKELPTVGNADITESEAEIFDAELVDEPETA
jgi:hypothetical protein